MIARRCLVGLVIAAGAVHLAAFGAIAWQRTAAARRALAADRFPDSDAHQVSERQLRLVMPELLAAIPSDARLLVVTDSLTWLSFELYSAPRPTRILCRLDEAVLSPRRPLDPIVRFVLRSRFEQLEAEERRFTDERYAREFAQASHLVVLNAAPREWAIGGVALVPLRAFGDPRRPVAAAFRIDRG